MHNNNGWQRPQEGKRHVHEPTNRHSVDAKKAWSRRSPGGALPDGWEFFRDYSRPIWFGFTANTPEGYDGILVIGVLPMRCPLDSVFEKPLAHKQNPISCSEDDGNDTSGSTDSENASNPRCQTSRALLRREEANRSSKARFFERLPVEKLKQHVLLKCRRREQNTPGHGVDLKAVINLCATTRYYDGKSLEDQGVEFVHFKVDGGGIRMPNSQLAMFLQEVKSLASKHGVFYQRGTLNELPDLIENFERPLPIIGIHCTHGVNRTGFCVISLLCIAGLENLEEGLDLFYRARGHDINKDELIHHLHDIWFEPTRAALYADLRALIDTNAATFCI